MKLQQGSDDRAVSPVVGVTLLIGITVILASVIGSVVLSSGIGPTDTPHATLSFKMVDDGSTVELYHGGGEPLKKEEIVIRDESGNTYELPNDRFVTGERVSIADLDPNTVEQISVVWQDPYSSSESVLATFRP